MARSDGTVRCGTAGGSGNVAIAAAALRWRNGDYPRAKHRHDHAASPMRTPRTPPARHPSAVGTVAGAPPTLRAGFGDGARRGSGGCAKARDGRRVERRVRREEMASWSPPNGLRRGPPAETVDDATRRFGGGAASVVGEDAADSALTDAKCVADLDHARARGSHRPRRADTEGVQGRSAAELNA